MNGVGFVKSAAAAAFALAVGGLALGCGGGGGSPSGPVVDNELAGEWVIAGGVNEKGCIILKLSGEVIEGTFQKVGGFWIEGQKEGAATWGANRNSGVFYVKSSVWTDTMRYELSGGSLVTTSCYPQIGAAPECRESRLVRVDLAVFRASLGEVYADDKSLYIPSKAGYSDLMWRLQGGSEVLDFDAVYFRGGERYVSGYNTGMWYAAGGKLVLLDVECASGGSGECAAAELRRVELDYAVTDDKLTISGDTWLPAQCDAGCYGQAKSRRDAPRAFSPLSALTGRI